MSLQNRPISVTSIDQVVTVFPSALGWMAIANRDEVVRGLTFGHRSAAAAAKSLADVLCHARRVDDRMRLLRRSRTEWKQLPQHGRQSKWSLSIVERLQAYVAGNRDDFRHIVVDLDGLSQFRRRVIASCRQIPYGTTITYAALAAKAGFPRAVRAVGSCMAGNYIPLIIPCHRVVRSDGSLGGYSAAGGVKIKQRLLQLESANPDQ